MHYEIQNKKRGMPREGNTDPLDVSGIDPMKLLVFANAVLEFFGDDNNSVPELPPSTEYDVFISHSATESNFVDALAKHLTRLGLKVCYDSLSFTNGDFLLSSMDRGMESSHLCVAILSPSYFDSYWCRVELNAILQLEKIRGSVLLIPVWHQVQHTDVMKFSPIIASRKALSTNEYSAAELAIEVKHLLAA